MVEASWRLGDRLLLLTSPNLRGDDVASLQTHLGVLGFDCGKVDGIFGPLIVHALEDFQANCGLVVDGICGPVTIQLIDRVRRQTGTGPGVATMRERDRIQSRTASLRQLRVVLGQFGGLSTLTRALARDLRSCGAIVISVDEPDGHIHADAANHFEADVYVGFASINATGGVVGSQVAYYSVPTFESAGGRSLSERIAAGLAVIDHTAPTVHGMRLQVLRETRMPAVLVSVTEVRRVVDRSVEVTAVIRDALEVWAGRPLAG